MCVCVFVFFFFLLFFALLDCRRALSLSLFRKRCVCVRVCVRAHGIEIVAHKVLFRAAGIRFSIAHTPTEEDTLNTTL